MCVCKSCEFVCETCVCVHVCVWCVSGCASESVHGLFLSFQPDDASAFQPSPLQPSKLVLTLTFLKQSLYTFIP